MSYTYTLPRCKLVVLLLFFLFIVFVFPFFFDVREETIVIRLNLAVFSFHFAVEKKKKSRTIMIKKSWCFVIRFVVVFLTLKPNANEHWENKTMNVINKEKGWNYLTYGSHVIISSVQNAVSRQASKGHIWLTRNRTWIGQKTMINVPTRLMTKYIKSFLYRKTWMTTCFF